MRPEARDRLARVLEHARTTVPHYAGLPALPEQADEADLARLPVLSRQALQRGRSRLLTAAADATGWYVSRTTGTTGEPVEVVRDGGARAAEATVLARHVDGCLGARQWRDADFFHVTLHAGATSRTQPAPWGAGRAIKWNLLPVWQVGDERFLAAVAHLHGAVFTAMPSVAELLARRLAPRSAWERPRPRLAVLSGETVEQQSVACVGEVLGCRVTSFYTLGEVGIVGSACATHSGYHVEDEVAIVEVTGDGGAPVGVDKVGEILVTTLANLAMPLVRYRTADQGYWDNGPCGCGRAGPRLHLIGARRPVRIATSAGLVNVVRFAKTLAALPVDQVRLDQFPNGVITISYRAHQALDQQSTALVDACLRASVGPEPAIRYQRTPAAVPRASNEAPVAPAAAEPTGPGIADVAHWLRGRLEGEAAIVAAAITGSSLDVDSMTRFSDVDLVLLVGNAPREPYWLSLCRELRARVPRLATAVDTADQLGRRAPLFACRLLSEQHPLVGRIDGDLLPWPSTGDLRSQGRFWAQEAGALLWQRLTTSTVGPFDPVREAWLAGKLALDGLRYHYLVQGERCTAARHIVELARGDRRLTPWARDLFALLEVAREQRPPLPATLEGVVPTLTTAIACIAHVAGEL